MYKLLSEITAYLQYLNGPCGLNVTVHFTEQKVSWFSDRAFAMLLPYNVHKNPYCTQVKKKDWQRCTLSQKKVIAKKCESRQFCGMCYAGVYEYICQIMENDQVVGFVSVSGYRREEGRARCADAVAWETYLSPEEPPTALLDALIPPLCRMLELLFTYPQERHISDDYIRILQLLHERNGQTSLEELCERFGRSKSYISHLFNEKSGVTLRAYCNELKLEYARKLLTATELPVTDIALEAGFNDVSYFIVLFRQQYGITPLKYRKERAAGI